MVYNQYTFMRDGLCKAIQEGLMCGAHNPHTIQVDTWGKVRNGNAKIASPFGVLVHGIS